MLGDIQEECQMVFAQAKGALKSEDIVALFDAIPITATMKQKLIK